MISFFHKHKGKVNGKKVFHTILMVVIGFATVMFVLWYYQETKRKKEITNPISTSTTVYNETDSWYKIKNSEYGFEIKFLGSVLTKTEYLADFGQYGVPDKFESIKLISTARQDLIGNQQCFYGQSGIATVCNVAQEGGVLIVPMSLENMNMVTNELNKNLSPSDIVVAGKKAHKYEMGVEGEGEDSYYIKINDSQGLLISRIYVDTFKPDPDFFQKILDTLIFTK